MGLFDFVGDLLGLSPPSTGDAMSKEDIAWLMDKALTGNRTNNQGLFTGYQWSESPDGTWTQTQSINPALHDAIGSMLGRLGSKPQAYKSNFGDLAEAMLNNRHAQYGLAKPDMKKNANFGKRPGASVDFAPPKAPQGQRPADALAGVLGGGFGAFNRIPRDGF